MATPLREIVKENADLLRREQVSGLVLVTREQQGDMCIITPNEATNGDALAMLRRAKAALSRTIAEYESKMGEKPFADMEDMHLGTLRVDHGN